MRKIITCIMLLLFALLLFSFKSNGQAFVGLQATNKGVGVQFGILVERTAITMAYKVPVTSNTEATLLSLTIGQEFLLSNYEEDNYTISIHAGAASYKVKDFSKESSDGIKDTQTFTGIYNLELGKDSYAGRLFLSANYCKSFYFGIGMKVYFSKL